MKRKIFCAAILLSFSVIACDNQKKSNSEQLPVDLSVKKTTNSMNSFVSIFEIPATEISRAVGFYQEILAINIDQMDV